MYLDDNDVVVFFSKRIASKLKEDILLSSLDKLIPTIFAIAKFPLHMHGLRCPSCKIFHRTRPATKMQYVHTATQQNSPKSTALQ